MTLWLQIWLQTLAIPGFFVVFVVRLPLHAHSGSLKKLYPGIIPEIFPRSIPVFFFLTDHFQPTTKPARKQKKPVKSFPKRVKCLVKLKIGKVVGFPSKGWYLFFPSEIKFGCGPLSVTVANEGFGLAAPTRKYVLFSFLE